MVNQDNTSSEKPAMQNSGSPLIPTTSSLLDYGFKPQQRANGPPTTPICTACRLPFAVREKRHKHHVSYRHDWTVPVHVSCHWYIGNTNRYPHLKPPASEIRKHYKQWNRYRHANRNRINEKERQYKLANKNKINEQRRQYKLANKDKAKEYQKQYRTANSDRINEQKRQYRLANRDKEREQQRQYRLANKDRINERARQWYHANKAKVKGKAVKRATV